MLYPKSGEYLASLIPTPVMGCPFGYALTPLTRTEVSPGLVVIIRAK